MPWKDRNLLEVMRALFFSSEKSTWQIEFHREFWFWQGVWEFEFWHNKPLIPNCANGFFSPKSLVNVQVGIYWAGRIG